MIDLLRHLILKDFWLKLFSFALAVLIWFTVSFAIHKNSVPTRTLHFGASELTLSDLPVVVMSSASDVRSFKVNPQRVDVTVRGDAHNLKTLQKKDVHVIVDLTGIEAAHDLRKLIEVSTPPGVTYVRADPDEVQVIFPPKD